MTTSNDNTAASIGTLGAESGDPHEQKIRAEIAKLQAETRALQKPLSQLSAWIPVAVAAGGILAAVGQWQHAEVAAQRSLLKIELEQVRAQAQIQRAKEELAQYQKDFLERVVHNLNLTRDAAANYYAPTGEWWNVHQLRNSNLAIESLLNTMSKTQLLPPDLASDLERLRSHYAEWHAAYKRAFPDGQAVPHATKIAVGTFPVQSEDRIRTCLQSLLKGEHCG